MIFIFILTNFSHNDQVAGTPYQPSAGAVDLAQFRKVYRERGPVSEDPRIQERLLTEEELALRRKRHGYSIRNLLKSKEDNYEQVCI